MTKPNVLTQISEADVLRFHEMYEPQSSECWLWTGRVTMNGYGRMVLDTVQHSAHRVSYLIHHGSVNRDLVIDHLCRNRACVNPDHLEQVTQSINVRRGDICAQGRTGLCLKGHSVSGDNALTQGKRTPICRSCNRDYMREYMRNRRLAAAH